MRNAAVGSKYVAITLIITAAVYLYILQERRPPIM